MKKGNKFLILCSFLMVSCGTGSIGSVSGIFDEVTYDALDAFEYGESTARLYVQKEDLKRYYSYVYGSVDESLWRVSYEYRPEQIESGSLDSGLLSVAYDIIREHFSDICARLDLREGTLYLPGIYYLEQELQNERSEAMGVCMVETYLCFSLSYNFAYAYFALPVRVGFLKQYGDEVQAFEDGGYLKLPEFLERYDILLKENR